ncbi:MAG: hypothetical protein E7618_03395 [Ruminococcaceae bacterium]|nr:hypothetical protein [Oscillospiraceae bacterium]
MKKTKGISILFIIIVSLCFPLFSACQEEDSTAYLTVYGAYDVLSIAGNGIFRTAPFVNQTITHPKEEGIPPRTEILFGTEVELQYTDTVERYGRLRDTYVSQDKRYQVNCERTTGRIVGIFDEYFPETDGQAVSDEDVLRIATEFAAETWGFVRDGAYVTTRVVNHENYSTINFYRVCEGLVTTDNIHIGVRTDGSICRWSEGMVYPDDLPESVRQAIRNFDLELCRKSVEKYIRDCGKESGKKIVFDRFLSDEGKIYFSYTGVVAWFVEASMTIDGQSAEHGFLVELPYEAPQERA